MAYEEKKIKRRIKEINTTEKLSRIRVRKEDLILQMGKQPYYSIFRVENWKMKYISNFRHCLFFIFFICVI